MEYGPKVFPQIRNQTSYRYQITPLHADDMCKRQAKFGNYHDSGMIWRREMLSADQFWICFDQMKNYTTLQMI